MCREWAHPWGYVIVNFAALYRTVNCSSVYNTTVDVSQIRMRETCALRISGEIRGDTLLISRLSRFSGGGTQLHRWEDEEEKEEGRKEEVDFGLGKSEGRRWMRILYPRVRNCDALPCVIFAGIFIRERRVNTANREMYYYLSRKFTDSVNNHPIVFS